MTPDAKKEISTTVRWGVGIILTILVQTIGFVWYLSQRDALLDQHTQDIAELQSGTSIYISRSQLDDILGGTQVEIKGLKDSLLRIETKLDRVIR